MAEQTPNLDLRKPDMDNYANVVTDISGNMDKIDAAFGVTAGHDHDGSDSKKIVEANITMSTSTGHDHDGANSKKVDPSDLVHKIRGSEIESTTDAQKVANDNIKNLTLAEGKLIAASIDGLHPYRSARVTYDFAEHGGTQGVITLGVTLPDNAIIIRSWYEVLTTLTSSTDAATISIDIPTDDVAGIVAATAISAGGNVWDAGLHEAIQDGAVANASTKTTATRELQITIAGGEDVTAGKFILFAEYVVSD